MKESRVATGQGENIRRFTRVTVVRWSNAGYALLLLMILGISPAKSRNRKCLRNDGTSRYPKDLKAIFGLSKIPQSASWAIYLVLVIALALSTLVLIRLKDIEGPVKSVWRHFQRLARDDL